MNTLFNFLKPTCIQMGFRYIAVGKELIHVKMVWAQIHNCLTIFQPIQLLYI